MTYHNTHRHIQFYVRLSLGYPAKCPRYVALLDKRSIVKVIYMFFISPSFLVIE
jgi:hypothetical protein